MVYKMNLFGVLNNLYTNQVSNINFNLYYSSMFVFQEKSLVFIAGGSTDNQCQYPTNQITIYDVNVQKTSVFFLSVARCNIGINAISKKNLKNENTINKNTSYN